ncbi:MAG: hypothetical protein MSA07_02705 [Mucispirillum sp.]|nr:hypothetical protein [Mucispirillum sp.]
MKKFILFIFAVFISSNVYGAEINFSNNNGIENNEMCVSTMFYNMPVEICRPISPWGKAVVKNTTIKEIYPQFKTLMADYHPLYAVLLDKLPSKDTKTIIDVENLETNIKPRRISTKTGIQDLSGEVIYTVKPDIVNITIRANGVEAKIEFKQQSKDVVINKDSEYLDFLVENRWRDDEGFPYLFNDKPHDFYGDKENIWVDYVYISDIKTKSGTVYKDIPIFFHKHPVKTVMENASINDLYNKLNSDELPSAGTKTRNVTSDGCGKAEYVWDDNGSVGVIDTSCEIDNKYYSYYIQNGNNAECYFLPIDWLN